MSAASPAPVDPSLGSSEAAPAAASQADAQEVRTLAQPQGRLGMFLQGMFVLTLFAAIYAISSKSGWLDRIPGMMLFAIGAFAIVAVRKLGAEAIVRVELVATSLKVHRRGGRVGEVALGELLLVRKDVGPDEELAYFLQFDGDRHVRLRAPSREQPQLVQTFVEQLVERAELRWTGSHAKRA